MVSLSGSLSRCLARFQRHRYSLLRASNVQCSSTQSAPHEKPLEDFKIVKLSNKSLLKLSGSDVIPFLQGLVTNDVTQLQRDFTSVYTMMLNIKGRVLCDLMLYKAGDESLIVEVDSSQNEFLQKIFKKYKIRKKVKIEDITEKSSVYALFGHRLEKPIITSAQSLYRDPRLWELGWRLVSYEGLSDLELCDQSNYHQHRYKLGVGEGPYEHIPEKALPLECNLVLLNGVNFSKGCYLGQELTARSHHTGVIRKRIMPVKLETECHADPYADVRLKLNDKSAGALRCYSGVYGVGLLRLNHVLQESELYITDKSGRKVGVETVKPNWWPDDLIVQ